MAAIAEAVSILAPMSMCFSTKFCVFPQSLSPTKVKFVSHGIPLK